MPVVEVSCPNCGARLKAPDNMAGKKAKCKKCGKGFRIPGPAPASETAGDGQALSAMAMPTPALPDDDLTEVMMAEPVPEPIPAAPAPPAPLPPALAKDLSALPSADPFDFGKTAKPAPAAPAAKPTFGAAKAAPAPPAAPKPAPPAPAPPAAPAPAKAKSGTVPQPAPKPAPLPLENIPFDEPAKGQSAAKDKAKAEPPASNNPFAFSDAPADEKPAKKRRDDEEEDRPRKKRRDDDDDEDDRPAKGKRRDEEDDEDRSRKKRRDEEDDDRPRKKKRDDDENDDRPSKSKRRDDEDDKPAEGKGKEKDKGKGEPEFTFGGAPAEEPAGEEAAPAGDNPFSFSALVDAPDEKPAKKRRDDDDDDDRPRKKRRDDEDDDRGSKSKRRDEDDDDRPRKKRRDDEDEGEPEKPRYLRPDEKGGSGKTILITAGIGLVALALMVVAVIVYKNNNKPPEPEKKEERKEDPPAPPAPGPPNPPPPDPKKPKDPDPKVPKDPDPKKPKDPEPKVPKDPDPKKPKDPVPVNARPDAVLPKPLRTFTVGAPPAKPMRTDDRKNDPPVLDVPLASVRRLFPPADPKTGDTFVLIQTAPAAGGKNERLALERYGPAGNRVATDRIDFDGDGAANPIADMHSTVTGTYFLAASGGKLNVWSLAESKMKVADAVNPYADKPDHAKAGLAAAFFAPDPTQVVTVSTAGAVLLFDLRTKKVVAEFVPPDGVPGKVALGQSVAKADNNASIMVAVAGVIYQIQPKSELEVVRKHDLTGNVGRSLGLAAGGTPGRFLYVFEAIPDKTGKKDIAVMALQLGAKANHVFFQFPTAAVGEPKGAFWANGDTAGVATDRGVVWFYDHPDENKFQPLVFAQPPTGAGLYFGDEKHFWYVIPHTTMPTKSVVVAVSADFNDRSEYWKNFPGQLRTVRIDSTGLSK